MSPSPARAFASPVALAVLGIGVVAAALLGSAPIGAIGALTYLALVAWDLSGGLPLALPAPPREVVLPDPESMVDPEVRGSVAQIVAARAEREVVIRATPDSVLDHLGSALRSVDELERNAVVLAARGEDLARWLATQDVSKPRAETKRLAELAAASRDESARIEYERARAEREEHVRALSDVQSSLERIRAHLARIAASLSSVPPKLVRMRALDVEAMDLVGAEVARDLASLDEEVRVFEHTLRTLGQERSG